MALHFIPEEMSASVFLLQPLELAPGIFKYIQLKKLSKAIVQSA
jgi:hypothetical protein